MRYVDVGRVPVDLDGDGYSDVVVGDPERSQGAEREGNVFVYRGGSGVGPSPSLILDNPDGIERGRFGDTLSTGDLNADGFADLVVGEPNLRSGSIARAVGTAFVYLGGASGSASVPDHTLRTPPDEETRFSGIVSAGSDVDGDGFSDFLLGLGYTSHGGMDEVWLFHGGSGGLREASGAPISDPSGQPTAGFGRYASLAGDTDSDGYDEMLVGAPDQDWLAQDEGAAYVYSGGPYTHGSIPVVVLKNPTHQEDGGFGTGVAEAGDVNGDGYGDIIVGALPHNGAVSDAESGFLYFGGHAGLAVTPGVILNNPRGEPHANFATSLARAGDLNGDGFDDVVAATIDIRPGTPSYGQGTVYLYHGAASGIGTTPSVVIEDPLGWPETGFGWSTAPAGDVNGDGYADLVVGAPGPGARFAGGPSVFVYYGGPDGVPATPSVRLDSPPGDDVIDAFGAVVASGAPAPRPASPAAA